MRFLQCVCGRECRGLAGLRNHGRVCPVERARSDAWAVAIERGQDPLVASATAVRAASRSGDSEAARVRLTDLQLEVLDQVDEVPLRPMDMGGRDGSHHSNVLAALARKGLVERVMRSPGSRGAYLYRITPAGIAVRRAHRQSDDVESPEESAAIVDRNLLAMGSQGLEPGDPS